MGHTFPTGRMGSSVGFPVQLQAAFWAPFEVENWTQLSLAYIIAFVVSVMSTTKLVCRSPNVKRHSIEYTSAAHMDFPQRFVRSYRCDELQARQVKFANVKYVLFGNIAGFNKRVHYQLIYGRIKGLGMYSRITIPLAHNFSSHGLLHSPGHRQQMALQAPPQ